jgi:hypothetical protein
MLILKTVSFFLFIQFIEWICAEGVWAWGPGVHTVIACGILDNASQILPVIGGIIRSFPLEYLYGSLSADFFVGKGQKPKEGHSHNWKTGYVFLNEARDEREVAYACGFLSHLAADVVAHNYFIPNLIHLASTWKRLGHLYWEAKADYFIGPVYIKMARAVLKTDQPECDDLLKIAVRRHRKILKARRHVFTQTVKISDYLCQNQALIRTNKNKSYHQVPHEYLMSMIGLSYRIVKHFMTYPDSSPCLFFDPIGSENLRLAGQHGLVSKFFHIPRTKYRFNVDEELLKI